MKNPYDIIKSPLISEKIQSKGVLRIYGFMVDRTANKLEVKAALEKIYNVKIEKVNVITMPGKKRRLRFHEGYTPSWKKALVRLKEGQSLNIV